MGGMMSDGNANVERQLGPDFPEGEHYVGFDNNKNNICYANSILQALYYCVSFREQILKYKPSDPKSLKENIILIVQDIFQNILHNKKRVNTLSTKKLMTYVQRKNCMFSEDYHHDSHEFLIWFLNEINDVLQEEQNDKKAKTWLTDIFEGQLENQTACLQCNVVSKITEPFLDLSLDLEENTSLNFCIKKLGKPEIMQDQNQFQCDNCKTKQDASKQIKIRTLPRTLIFHFKRFKYDERLNRLTKLNWKIAFSFDIRIDSICESENRLYKLYAVLVHIGPGFQFGHYICFIKNNDRWIQFDDEAISLVEESQMYSLFGNSLSSMSAYMLFYQLEDVKIFEDI